MAGTADDRRVVRLVEGDPDADAVGLTPADVAQARAALGALEVLDPADALARLQAEVEPGPLRRSPGSMVTPG